MKIKWNNIAACILSGTLLLAGCTSSFDDLNADPDSTNKVPSSMLATDIILDMVKSSYNWKNEFLVKRMFWGEQIDDSQYNRFGKTSFSSILKLTNAQKMVELASENNKDAYTGLYYFMKGWYFWRATMETGDIPYSEALNIEEHTYPKFDEQKDVFKGILSDLKQAEEYFGKATHPFSGDPFYEGDIEKWKKATNVLRLKVLMSLQKRADDTPELQVKEQFQEIVNSGILFTSNKDNLQVEYSDLESNRNPYHKEYTRSIETFAATTMIVDPMKEYKDKRLFYYLAPAQALTDPIYLPKGETLLQPNDWDAYRGVDVAGVYANEMKQISTRMHSRPNDVYRLSYSGVPSIRLGYADMNFLLAEAAERGWIEGSAKRYYEEGVRASFEFVRTTVPTQYHNGVEITDTDIEIYLHGEKTAYNETGTMMDRLHQIWMQTYLAGYFHMAYDAYFDYRRTGYPAFPINPDTNLNTQNDKIPMRWLYPDSENDYNKEQLKIALERQWNGVDDVNNIMWILK